jgi:hypothetical protein
VPISVNLGNLLEQHSSKLDIIYEDDNQTNSSQKYSQLINWNNTLLNPSSIPTPQKNSSNEGSSFEKIGIKWPAEVQGAIFAILAVTSVIAMWVFLRKGSTKTREIKANNLRTARPRLTDRIRLVQQKPFFSNL